MDDLERELDWFPPPRVFSEKRASGVIIAFIRADRNGVADSAQETESPRAYALGLFCLTSTVL
jgi:hypothetical protein